MTSCVAHKESWFGGVSKNNSPCLEAKHVWKWEAACDTAWGPFT